MQRETRQVYYMIMDEDVEFSGWNLDQGGHSHLLVPTVNAYCTHSEAGNYVYIPSFAQCDISTP